MDNTELMHHGIRGQKWGIRRFQNKDGSLTAAGKKRVQGKGDSKKPTKSGSSKSQPSSKPKSVKEMTDAELNKSIKRLQLEQQYNNLQPKQVSAGKEYAKKFLDQAIIPAATNIGKQFLEKELKKALGLDANDDNSLDAMKKTLDELRTRNQFHEEKKKLEKYKAEAEEDRKAREAKESEKDAKKEAKAAEKQAKKEAKAAEKQARKETEKVKVDRVGTDYSQYNVKKGRDTIVDADFEDVVYDSRRTSTTETGRNYLNQFLLEEKN